ncbi:hypothetical protein C5940_18890 [Cronobacter sakazakii]|nr:hypothetical protein C5940_18890 [Cronobacter sakazakii]
MTDCCIPQQNPGLYAFAHRVIHRQPARRKFASATQTFSLQCGPVSATRFFRSVSYISVKNGWNLANALL